MGVESQIKMYSRTTSSFLRRLKVSFIMTRRKRYCTLRKTVTFAIISCVVVNLIFLVYFPPKLLTQPCPAIFSFPSPWSVGGEVSITTGKSMQCNALFNETFQRATNMESYKWCQRRDIISEDDYLTLTENCDAFRTIRGYSHQPITEEETEFPLAFSILTHEQVEQTERLLRAIYRPHNIYCIHVDAKSPQNMHEAIKAIANCLPNVFLSSQSIQVHWAEFSVLEAEMVCLRDLWTKSNDWKYYMNLAGREFPLRTNWELVQILKAYNGGNEVDGSLTRRPREWTEYSWRREYWRTNKLKDPPPHGFHIAKGSTHVAVSRAFVDYVLHDQRAKDLLEWMRDVRCPDEHFFPTLNNNPHLSVPGAYTGNPDLRDGFFVRFKLWQDSKETCHGKWNRYICTLGSGDLPRLVGSKHMFVNKLNLDLDPVAFQCIEEMYYQRVERKQNMDFDIDFYKSRKLVEQHV